MLSEMRQMLYLVILPRCRDGVAFDGAACEGAPAALKAH